MTREARAPSQDAIRGSHATEGAADGGRAAQGKHTTLPLGEPRPDLLATRLHLTTDN